LYWVLPSVERLDALAKAEEQASCKMGLIKTLLGVVILVANIVFGYWLYATYTIASADDEIWVKVNSNMPAPLRKWACAEVNGRVGTADAPTGCGDAWETAAAPTGRGSTIPQEPPAETAPSSTNSSPSGY
jgi:hypothetical protein